PADPVRIEPQALEAAREELLWALSRVAHGANDWLDLETFLTDLGSATPTESSRIYWYSNAWHPEFRLARIKASLRVAPTRRRAAAYKRSRGRGNRCTGLWSRASV